MLNRNADKLKILTPEVKVFCNEKSCNKKEGLNQKFM